MNIRIFQGLLFFLIQLIQAEKFIIELENDLTFEKFREKYNSILKMNNSKDELKFIKIGNNFNCIIGEFNNNLLKSMYFDKSIKSINSDSTIKMCEFRKQSFAPRHLVRLSQLNPVKMKQEMVFNYDLTNPVNIYLLDTGVNSQILDFNNRVKIKKKIKENVKLNSNLNDLNGHGTSVASVVGSELLGVCKNCNLISYQVLNSKGLGKLSELIETLNLIYENEEPSVLLLPFITNKSIILNNLMKEFKDLNYLIVVPAGNFNDNACKYSPGSSIDVITVGSIDSNTDTIAKFSNFGPCVDIFTDGINIMTLNNNYNEENSELIEFKSGTSLSAGITAGLIASFLGIYNDDDNDNENRNNNRNNNRNKDKNTNRNKMNNFETIKKLHNVAIENKIKPFSFFKDTKTPNRILNNYNGKIGNALYNYEPLKPLKKRTDVTKLSVFI